MSTGNVVGRAFGSVNNDSVYGDRDHRFAELSRLSHSELGARYLGVRDAYDALRAAVDRHGIELRALGAHTDADTGIEDFLDTTDRRAHDALALSQIRLQNGDATPQRYVVAILNLERWIVAVGRAIEHHHQLVGAEADVAPELLEIDRRLWSAPQDIGDRFRVDIAGRREAAR